MPFKETCRMEERVGMLAEYDSGHWSVSELCRRRGVSRDTFYAWRARRASGEADWFCDRPHSTLSCPHRTDEGLEAEIVAVRRRFTHLGPRKLLAMLARRAPETDWSAASTIGDILKRAGWSSLCGADAARSMRLGGRSRPRQPTTNGRPTSKAGFARRTSVGSIR